MSCPHCGRVFARTHHRQTYCAKPCAKAARDKRDANRHKVGAPNRSCEICGESYRCSYSKQRTCGRVCGAMLQARSRPAPEPKTPSAAPKLRHAECRHCGTAFEYTTGRGGRIYCSRRCSHAYHNSLRYGDRTPRACPGCGQRFAPANAGRVFCNSACRKRSTKHYRDRARRFGVAYEPINPDYVFARDRWTCGICRQKVLPAASYPHPQSPSLDHVVPMARGGEHVLANVQLAHLACNWRKNAGFVAHGEQLALIG